MECFFRSYEFLSFFFFFFFLSYKTSYPVITPKINISMSIWGYIACLNVYLLQCLAQSCAEARPHAQNKVIIVNKSLNLIF